jgi:hypothetical protein
MSVLGEGRYPSRQEQPRPRGGVDRSMRSRLIEANGPSPEHLRTITVSEFIYTLMLIVDWFSPSVISV